MIFENQPLPMMSQHKVGISSRAMPVIDGSLPCSGRPSKPRGKPRGVHPSHDGVRKRCSPVIVAHPLWR
jgi:hypothetical protein